MDPTVKAHGMQDTTETPIEARRSFQREYYYDLSPDILWIPFYADPPYAKIPEHLLSDLFLPFFSLMSMFGMESKKILLTSVNNALRSAREWQEDCEQVFSVDGDATRHITA